MEIDGTQGMSVIMGDDEEKALDMAIIDAAVNMGVFDDFEKLTELEQKQNRREMQEHAMNLRTMVSFNSLDQEAPHDLNAFKKA